MTAYFWEEFYNNQATVFLEIKAAHIRKFLECLEVMYGEGVIEDEGKLLLSNQARAKLEVIERILKERLIK
jgi:hypothetical protein